jgi:acetyltransferase
LQAAETIGYPVTLKIASAQVVHKTEVGGVKVGIANADFFQGASE